jgi:hypothetical protein
MGRLTAADKDLVRAIFISQLRCVALPGFLLRRDSLVSMVRFEDLTLNMESVADCYSRI